MFEGVVGTGYMNDIAIDDVVISRNQRCSLQPREAQPVAPTLPAPARPPCVYNSNNSNNNDNNNSNNSNNDNVSC